PRVAPTSSGSKQKFNGGLVKETPVSRSTDTLMYIPFPSIFITTNDNDFDVIFEDLDFLTPNNSGAPMDWGLYYSLDASVNGSNQPTADNFYHPWENPATDSAFFIGATSWFNPPGQANNWVILGPITLGQSNVVKWYDRTNPAYRDGYKVHVILASDTSATGPTGLDFTTPAIFTKTDAYPSPTYSTDTTWQPRTANIPASYDGERVMIAFNHNANDMDVLYLDEFVIAAAPASVNKVEFEGVKLNAFPNPASNVVTFSYALATESNVTINITDITGKIVASINEGTKSNGSYSTQFNTAALSAGTYFYSVVTNNGTATKKLVITK
ncbi:MAG: T9SS type A sorting domain-containing protein, partial [Bacteroidia bacterium]